MVSKKLMGARKLHCLGVIFLAVTLSSSAERLQAAAVSKEEQSLRQPLIRKKHSNREERISCRSKSKYLGAGTRCAETIESVYEGKPVT